MDGHYRSMVFLEHLQYKDLQIQHLNFGPSDHAMKSLNQMAPSQIVMNKSPIKAQGIHRSQRPCLKKDRGAPPFPLWCTGFEQTQRI